MPQEIVVKTTTDESLPSLRVVIKFNDYNPSDAEVYDYDTDEYLENVVEIHIRMVAGERTTALLKRRMPEERFMPSRDYYTEALVVFFG